MPGGSLGAASRVGWSQERLKTSLETSTCLTHRHVAEDACLLARLAVTRTVGPVSLTFRPDQYLTTVSRRLNLLWQLPLSSHAKGACLYSARLALFSLWKHQGGWNTSGYAPGCLAVYIERLLLEPEFRHTLAKCEVEGLRQSKGSLGHP